MKNIRIMVRKPSGEFLKDWSSIANFSGFSKEINGGLGECVLNLSVPFGYQGSDLNSGNIVDISVSDKDTAINGFVKIYSGYISNIGIVTAGGKSSVKVSLLGNYTRMSLDYCKIGSTTLLYSDSAAGLTSTASGSSADLGLILRATIDRYRAETENPSLRYDQGTIPLMSQTVLYTINLKTYREVFDKIIGMYAGYSFWYVDENDQVFVKSKPSTPTHIFKISSLKSLSIQKSIETTRNVLLIWNGETGAAKVYKEYKDEASIKQIGRRVEFLNDPGIGDEATADKLGVNFLAENKDPIITVTAEVIDNNDNSQGYDIESIQPGQTCRFIGFDPEGPEMVYDNMMITKVDYSPNKAVVTAEITKTDIVNWQEKTQKEVNDLKTSGLPASYS